MEMFGQQGQNNKPFLNPTISNISNNPFPKVLGLGRSSKTLLLGSVKRVKTLLTMGSTRTF